MILAGILSGLSGLLVDAAQAIMDALAAMVSAAINAWPIGMPTLPDAPSGIATVFGWVKWTPLPIDAAGLLLVFLIGVEILWQAVAIGLRWAKVID